MQSEKLQLNKFFLIKIKSQTVSYNYISLVLITGATQ